ncbi:hypothetical protein AB0395_39580 [Streptosporangium sp. NPDC051023]|uniref:hypothetical protein n=1 Tax=Streptosporangium sp. NPDC051023 TaxID=3155410 RepID=UPI00344EFB8F
MPDPTYLVAGIRTMPEYMTSPGYRNFLTWLGGQRLDLQGHVYEWATAASLPPGGRVYATYKTLTLWDNPARGVAAVYDLDEDGDRIPDGNGSYTTHDEDVTLTSLPSNTGVIPGDPT